MEGILDLQLRILNGYTHPSLSLSYIPFIGLVNLTPSLVLLLITLPSLGQIEFLKISLLL